MIRFLDVVEHGRGALSCDENLDVITNWLIYLFYFGNDEIYLKNFLSIYNYSPQVMNIVATRYDTDRKKK